MLEFFLGDESTSEDDSKEEETFTEYVGTTLLDSAVHSLSSVNTGSESSNNSPGNENTAGDDR